MKLAVTPVFILLFLCSFLYSEAQKGVRVGNAPSWITVNAASYTASKLDDEAQDGYMDAVFEKQTSLTEKSHFFKKGIRILSEAGVQNASKISVSFDPSYQEVIFHSVRIIRSGTAISKLHLSNIKTLQQERDLDRHLYDGSLSAMMILDDIRKGDVLEYSYTIKGMNPIFGGKYADMLEAQFSVPIGCLFYKLIVPAGRSVNIKNSQTSVQPAVSKQAEATVYEWKWNNVLPLEVEENIPSWYDPYPMVIVSEYKTWKGVAEWGTSLFPKTITTSPDLTAKINEIKKHSSDESRVLAALRFVQDDIRYMGIEMGTSSHKPHNPNQVVAQRFGDCKDKSYLLCVILNAMGIEANPVLINTTYKKTMKDWLPAANIFDHVTVQAKINGKTYWFDPTISYQRGRLQDISYPDHQAGLVLSNQTSDLSTIPLQDNGTVMVKEVIRVSDMSGKATLKVVTQYSGSNADYTRYEFQSNSIGEKRKEYADYYKPYFEKIIADSLSYEDNEETGIFTTIEEYTINNIWDKKKGLKELLVQPYVIDGVIKKMGDEDRRMPFALSYPVKYKEEIEVVLPEDWNADDYSDEVKMAAFSLNMNYSCSGNKIRLQYDYESTKDYVDPGEASQYASSIAKANENLAYSITRSDSLTYSNEVSTNSFLKGYNALYFLLGLCVLITYLVRRNRSSY